MFRRAARAVLALAVLALAATAAASADPGGAGTQTFTQHAHNVLLFSAASANPCDPSNTGTLTAVAANEVFHATQQADGDFWVTGTAEGTITFTPSNPAKPSATGHFATWFGESSNNKNDVQHDTGTFVLTASDGSHIVVHMVDHMSANAHGVVTAVFSINSARCG